MTPSIGVLEIKSRWNEVLDEALRVDRILWLTFFDARLADFSGGVLTLDFQDSAKFATEHDFSTMRNHERIKAMEQIAQNILQRPLVIAIK